MTDDRLATDEHFMAQALELAYSTLYVPTPNPRVGCLIVKDGQVIGQGVTQKSGDAHAEIMALRDAKKNQQSIDGATVYVTLEPCSHHGKTPPCTDALLKVKPARVVIGHVDPNPAVAGRGIEQFRAAGIEVTVGVLAMPALTAKMGSMGVYTNMTAMVTAMVMVMVMVMDIPTLCQNMRLWIPW